MLPMLPRPEDNPLPETGFADIPEAREALFNISLQYRRSMTTQEATELSRKYQAWDDIFMVYRSSLDRDPLSTAHRRALALLELHKKYLYINIEALFRPEHEEEYDVWTEDFRQMIFLAREACECDEGVHKPKTPLFHMDVGVLPPLVFLVAKCRHPEIRRQAIEIMQTKRIQEGIWNSSMAVKVATRVIQMEEFGLMVKSSEDIGNSARIRRIFADATPDRLIVEYDTTLGMLEEELD